MRDLATRYGPLQINVKASLGGKMSATVTLDYWMSVFDVSSYNFILDFQNIYSALSDRATLDVSYKFYDYSFYNSTLANALCFAKGRYCVPEKFRSSAAAYLEEGVRQICLFQSVRSRDLQVSDWFSYISQYRDCLARLGTGNTVAEFNCAMQSTDGLKVAGDLWDEVTQCFTNSFEPVGGDHATANNTMFDHCQSSMDMRFYNIIPSLIINKQLYKENLEPKTVVSAICSEFDEQPPFCKDFFTSGLDWSTKRKNLFEQGKFIGVVLVSIFLLIVIVIGVCIRSAMKRKIRSEIDEFIKFQVSSYVSEANLKASRSNFSKI